jgi:lysophospholipase L1-like esterase
MKLVATGDSITNAGPMLSYAKQVSDELGFTSFVNTAQSGYTSAQILANLPSMVLNHAPTHCMLMIGTNDVYFSGVNGNTVKELRDIYYNNVSQITTQLVSSGIKTTLISPPTSHKVHDIERFKAINDALKEIRNTKPINYIDIFERTLFGCGYYGPDQFKTSFYFDDYHPNQAGHNLIKSWIMMSHVK